MEFFGGFCYLVMGFDGSHSIDILESISFHSDFEFYVKFTRTTRFLGESYLF